MLFILLGYFLKFLYFTCVASAFYINLCLCLMFVKVGVRMVKQK